MRSLCIESFVFGNFVFGNYYCVWKLWGKEKVLTGLHSLQISEGDVYNLFIESLFQNHKMWKIPIRILCLFYRETL